MTEEVSTVQRVVRMVSLVVIELVDDERQVAVDGMLTVGPAAAPDHWTLNVSVAPVEVGKLIGKQGRTARSLRSLVMAAGRKHGLTIDLNIVGSRGVPEYP